MDTAIHAFAILFGIHRFLFFGHDSERNLLKVLGASRNFGEGAADNLVLPAAGHISLLSLCFNTGKRLSTLQLPEGLTLSIADEQILRFLGTEGMLCFPMVAGKVPVGIIVAGASSRQARELSEKQKLLDLFASHTGMCLHVYGIQQNQARRLQAERFEASTTMARKVVHEVNNPLGIIKNYLKILGLKLPEKHPAQAELQVISEEIDRVGHIIRSLRDFANPASITLEVLNLNLLLDSILALVDGSILKPAMIRLHFAPDDRAPHIQSEKNSLKQVVINLIKNAAESMPKGGNIHVSTRYHAADSPPSETGPEASDKVEIAIRDDGPGLPDEIRKHLFEPFHTTKEGGHSGLGLSIVHTIVSRLGGKISCDSSPDTGTAFNITLPTRVEERTDTLGGR